MVLLRHLDGIGSGGFLPVMMDNDMRGAGEALTQQAIDTLNRLSPAQVRSGQAPQRIPEHHLRLTGIVQPPEPRHASLTGVGKVQAPVLDTFNPPNPLGLWKDSQSRSEEDSRCICFDIEDTGREGIPAQKGDAQTDTAGQLPSQGGFADGCFPMKEGDRIPGNVGVTDPQGRGIWRRQEVFNGGHERRIA
jgi:hypothetical protein